jgi:hypothetical protein
MADAITEALQGHLADLHRRDHREALRPGRLQPPEGRFWQDGVLLPGASGPRRQTIDFGINYCRDGQPPQVAEVRAP